MTFLSNVWKSVVTTYTAVFKIHVFEDQIVVIIKSLVQKLHSVGFCCGLYSLICLVTKRDRM